MPRARMMVVPLVAVALLLSGCKPDPVAGVPSAARTATSWSTPTRSATPTPTPTATATATSVVVGCDTITTDAFHAAMLQTGWISWETQDDQVGSKPFALFPNGAPDGKIVCRWGLSPDVVSDNVYDLAFAFIDPENAIAAEQGLATRGFTRIDAPEGIYLASKSAGARADAEGWGSTYLFTTYDVRWAPTKADIAYITAPGGSN